MPGISVGDIEGISIRLFFEKESAEVVLKLGALRWFQEKASGKDTKRRFLLVDFCFCRRKNGVCEHWDFIDETAQERMEQE